MSATDYNELTVVQLRDRLRDLNLKLGGTKPELVQRLSEHTSTKSKSKAGAKAKAKPAAKGKGKASPKAKTSRPKSAFIFFSLEVRPEVKAAHPDLTFAEVAKAVGDRWHALSADERAKFEHMAAEAREEHAAAHPKATSTGVKRPRSAFILFSSDIRPSVKEEFPDLSLGEVSKVIGERWHALSAEEHEHYDELATADKARYEAELAAAPSA